MAAGGRRTARSRRSRGVCAERRGAAPAVCAGERDDCGGRRPSRGSGPASGGRGGGSMVCRDARRPPARRYRRAVERSVPDVASAIADAISGGHSVRGALAAAAGSLEGPSSAELSRVSADLELGASTADALAAMRARLRSERIDSLATALLSQQVAGGDIAALMRRLAAASADRDRMADEARAQRRRRGSRACWWSPCQPAPRCSPNCFSPVSSRESSASRHPRRCSLPRPGSAWSGSR